MGVYVDLTILPKQINAEEWQSVYEESLALLKGYPAEIMSRRREYVYSTERVVYTRQIEHDAHIPGRRYWHAVGDFQSKTSGESFVLYYDISRYYPRRYSEEHEGETDDILVSIAEERNDTCHVFRNKTQGYPYHIPVLAAAMLIEDRFPKYAVAGGNIDIHQAEAAQELVKQILKKEIALPVCSDGPRLFERLSEHYQGKEVLKHSDRLFDGDRDDLFEALFAMSDRQTFIQWFAEQLSRYKSPSQFGPIDLYISWLNVTKDLKTLCEVACIDENGPRFDPEAFASALANTWLTIEISERNFMDVFLKPKGATDTVATQFGMILLDAWGGKGRNMRHYMKQEEVLEIMGGLFPSHSEQIRNIFKDATEEIKEGMAKSRDGVQNMAKRADSKGYPEIGDGSSFVLLKSLGQASETQTFMLQALAFGVNGFRTAAMEEAPHFFEGPPEEMKKKIIRICNDQGPVLTEDAWEWIDNEEDHDLLSFIMILMLIKSYEQKFWNIRKGLLENRELCVNFLEMTRDKELLADVAKNIEAEQEKGKGGSK